MKIVTETGADLHFKIVGIKTYVINNDVERL